MPLDGEPRKSGQRRREPNADPDPSYSTAAGAAAVAATSVVVVCAHDLFSTGGVGGSNSGRGSEEKQRHLAAVRAFLACSTEVISFVERRVFERRQERESASAEAPYRQTEDSVGGVSIGALKSRAAWKAWLCQLVNNLKWAVGAASSLCVA